MSALRKIAAKKNLVMATLLILMALAVFIPVMKADFAIDDDQYVTENQLLRDANGLSRIWFERGAIPQYCPLVFTTYWIEYRYLWGDRPFGYHLVNILFHALGAILLWRILSRLRVAGSWLVAAIFLIHPVQVESLAWVSERKNTLSGPLYFAALLVYLYSSQFPSEERQVDNTRARLFYPLSILLFSVSLLAKQSASSLPFVILLIIWWKYGRIGLKHVLYLIPMFLLSFGSSLLAIRVEKAILDPTQIYPHRTKSTVEAFSLMDRCLIAGKSLWLYLEKLFWPVNLTCFYARWKVDPRMLWQWLFPISVIGIIFLLFLLRRRIGRGPLAGVLFFIGTLFPFLGFVDFAYFSKSFMADHYQYIACIGIIAAGVALGVEALDRPGSMFSKFVYIISVAVLLSFGALSWRQGCFYDSYGIMCRNNIMRSPGSATAWYGMGTYMLKLGSNHDAIPYFQQAIRLRPDYGDAYDNLGIALAEIGKLDDALLSFSEALRIDPKNAETHSNIGSVLALLGRYDAAMGHFYEALRLDPRNERIYVNIGLALVRHGRLEEAQKYFLDAVRISPGNEIAGNNLASILIQQGKTDEAISILLGSLRVNPNNPETHYNLGLAYFSKGNLDAAAREYQTALTIDPRYDKARMGLQAVMEALKTSP